MKRTVIAVLLAAGPLGVAAYACTTDTFTAGDAGDAGDAAPLPATQADFCDAEAHFASFCKIDDASCAADDIAKCGQFYGVFGTDLTTAITTCANLDQIPCTQSFFTTITTPGCVQNHLTDHVNDGGAFAQLTKDFCKTCAGGTAACSNTFSSSGQPGFITSLASDTVINQIDNFCTKGDGGPTLVGDASITCADTFQLCALATLGGALPPDSCKDGG